MGLVEGGLEVSPIVELVTQLIPVDIGLIDVLDSGVRRLAWGECHLFARLKLSFEEDLVVSLPNHRLFDPIPAIFGPQFLILCLDLSVGGSWLEIEDGVGLRCGFLYGDYDEADKEGKEDPDAHDTISK